MPGDDCRNPFVNQVSFFSRNNFIWPEKGRRNPFVNQVSFFRKYALNGLFLIDDVAIPS